MAKNKIDVTVSLDVTGLRKLLKNLAGTPTRILHDGKEYGIYQELGTSRGVPPHPFITPAIEAVRGPFVKGWASVLKNDISAEDFVAKIGFDAEAIAKTRAPYKTGDLQNSIRSSTPEEFLRYLG